MAPAGTYSIQLVGIHGSSIDTLTKPSTFAVTYLNNLSLPAEKPAELVALQKSLDALQLRMDKVGRQMDEVEARLERADKLVGYGVATTATLRGEVTAARAEWRTLNMVLNGDELIAGKEFETLPGLRDRLSSATWGSYSIRSEPTQTMKDQRRVVADQLADVEKRLAALMNQSAAW